MASSHATFRDDHDHYHPKRMVGRSELRSDYDNAIDVRGNERGPDGQADRYGLGSGASDS